MVVLRSKDRNDKSDDNISKPRFIKFVGMLTDSRSFISYTRHEYFRRIMCNLMGKWVENGEVPYDEEILKGIIQEICYLNAKNYFNLKEI